MEVNDKDFAIHKWMAIILDAKSELGGLKERVNQLATVKKHMLVRIFKSNWFDINLNSLDSQLAAELNPVDATSQYLLGAFAFGLADLPWIQKKVVTAVFGSPPDASYEEGLKYFLKAEELDPNFYSMNQLMLGKTYLRLKDNENAKKYLQMTSVFQDRNEEDKNAKEEAAQLLKKL